MNRLLVLSILMTLFAACTPQMNSLKQANCGDGHYFNEVTRSCVLDVSPKAPLITTNSLTISENAPKALYEIDYSDRNGDIATSCSIVDSGINLNQTLRIGSVKIERVNSWENSVDYSSLFFEIVDGPLITAGNETASIAGNTITLLIDAGATTSLQILNALNSNLIINSIIVSTLEGPNTVESITPGLKMLGASCVCTNGVCSLEIEPSRNRSGSSFIDFYLTDEDGDSAISRVNISIPFSKI